MTKPRAIALAIPRVPEILIHIPRAVATIQ